MKNRQRPGGGGKSGMKPNDPDHKEINFQDLEARRQFEYKKFGVMLNYASRFRRHCYRSFILRYFGEWTKNRECGNCSRCRPEKYPRNTKLEIKVKSASAVPVETTQSSTIV